MTDHCGSYGPNQMFSDRCPMSTQIDYAFDHENNAVTVYIEPHLFAEWQAMRLKLLSKGKAPNQIYDGSNLHHFIRVMGGSKALAETLAGSMSISYVRTASIIIDIGDDEIRFGHAHYYQRDGAGRFTDPMTCKTLKVACHEG